MSGPSERSRRWCFTLNNYSEDEVAVATSFIRDDPRVVYGVFGREVGTTGTPHLQGYIVFRNNTRLRTLRREFNERAHFEIARGTSEQASQYCKKDGDFVEFGSCPRGQGHRTDLERFKLWCVDRERAPTRGELIREFPGLYLRSGDRLLVVAAELCAPVVPHCPGTCRPWQHELMLDLEAPADDRKVTVVYDAEGNKGKSWFCRYMMKHRPDDVQILSVGKRDDIAYAIDESKRIFLFDIPRGQLEYFQWSVVEQLKNMMVVSNKYQVRTKLWSHPVHVVLFTNEMPAIHDWVNMSDLPMSRDRFHVITLN